MQQAQAPSIGIAIILWAGIALILFRSSAKVKTLVRMTLAFVGTSAFFLILATFIPGKAGGLGTLGAIAATAATLATGINHLRTLRKPN